MDYSLGSTFGRCLARHSGLRGVGSRNMIRHRSGTVTFLMRRFGLGFGGGSSAGFRSVTAPAGAS